MADLYIQQIKKDVEYYQSLLGQLESGKVKFGDSPDGRSLTDRTPDMIHCIKRVISDLQSVVENS